MRIFHTADLHLASDAPDTMEAFDAVLETAAENDTELLTIGGDVFDSPEDASRLRTEVRSKCSDQPFDILSIPGNHDADIFDHGFDLGTDLDVLRETPCDVAIFENVAVVGAPFQPRLTSDLYSALESAGNDQGIRVLLLHCTIDLGFGNDAAGAEEEGRYLPVELATLARLDYDYVLAGHIHVRYQTEPLDNGGTFVYPGSPISHTWTEQGPRHAALIDTDAGAVERIELPTRYRARETFTVTPGNQDEIPGAIEDWVGGHDLERASLEVRVDGYVDADEQGYNDRLREAAGTADIDPDVRSASAVLDHDIYVGVMERLDEEAVEEYERATAEGVERLLIDEMAPLIHSGEVR